jgi:hypothetical protein
VGQWHETYQHPLQRIAPPDRFVLREFAGAAAHPIVLCRCEAIGSPEQLAWCGNQCGPCFDRELDGEPPVGPFVPAVSQRVLLADEDGWIVERDGTVESLDPEGRVRWRRPGEGLDAHGGIRDLLLWARHREVCCVETRTGQVFKRWITREPIHDVRVLNDHTVVTVHASHLEWWYAGFTEPHRTTRFSGKSSGRLTCDPSGETLLLPTDAGIVSLSRHGTQENLLVPWRDLFGPEATPSL